MLNDHPILANNTMCIAMMDEDERRESFYENAAIDYDDDDTEHPVAAYKSFNGPYSPTEYGPAYANWIAPGSLPYFHGQALERREVALMSSTMRKQASRKLNGRNVGLFFGHENWSTILNLMIGIRTGLKMYTVFNMKVVIQRVISGSRF